MLMHKGTQTLQTTRLILRKATPEDAVPMFHNWASDPEVTRFLTWPTYLSVETAFPVLNGWAGEYEKNNFYLWMIVLREIEEPIGTISVVWQQDATAEAEIGYCIGRSWWRKGLMTEAVEAVIQFLFEEVGMHRIKAKHDVNNPHSGGVMRKCGMLFDTITRSSDRNNQGICDMAHYSILRCDWEKRNTPMALRNCKIIDAVIKKATKYCPESLALVGIYGSVATGDTHEKSDLDLLILIEDNNARQIGTSFILDDCNIGYDIYCTSWEHLNLYAECHHAQLSKLMDSKIVYVQKPSAYEQLCYLKDKATALLHSEERYQRVSELIEKAKICYANAALSENPGEVRLEAYGVMHYLMNAVMLYNGKYFRLGVKRALEELQALPIDQAFIETLNSIATSEDVTAIRNDLKILLQFAEKNIVQRKGKEPPSVQLTGTYEEMYSNWRNKVAEASDQNQIFLSFVNMCNIQHMLKDISESFEIGNFNILEHYNPTCLEENVKLLDQTLEQYKKIYQTAGIQVKHFENASAFAAEYLK